MHRHPHQWRPSSTAHGTTLQLFSIVAETWQFETVEPIKATILFSFLYMNFYTSTSVPADNKSWIAADRSTDAAVKHGDALHGRHRAGLLRHPGTELIWGYERALSPARAHMQRETCSLISTRRSRASFAWWTTIVSSKSAIMWPTYVG